MERGPGSNGKRAQSAEAAVFVTGGFGSSRDWEDLLPRVGQFCRVVTPDVLAAGGAAGDQARRLDVALDVLDVHWAHLLLHGSGGPAGLLWAAGHPEFFASAILIDAGLPSDAASRRLSQVLRPLGRPALVVCGAGNRPLFAGYAEKYRELFPDARIVLLEGAKDGLFAEDLEAVTDEVVLFLRRNLSGTAPNVGTQENARQVPRWAGRPTEGEKNR